MILIEAKISRRVELSWAVSPKENEHKSLYGSEITIQIQQIRDSSHQLAARLLSVKLLSWNTRTIAVKRPRRAISGSKITLDLSGDWVIARPRPPTQTWNPSPHAHLVPKSCAAQVSKNSNENKSQTPFEALESRVLMSETISNFYCFRFYQSIRDQIRAWASSKWKNGRMDGWERESLSPWHEKKTVIKSSSSSGVLCNRLFTNINTRRHRNLFDKKIIHRAKSIDDSFFAFQVFTEYHTELRVAESFFWKDQGSHSMPAEQLNWRHAIGRRAKHLEYLG